MSVNLIEVKCPVLKNKVHYVTSDYKTRNNSRSVHNGIDLIGNNRSTDYIIAIDSGIVRTSKYSSSAGYYVEIVHDNNYISRYLHMKKDSVKVKKGDKVNREDILGYMGNTGNSTGAHLHFQVNNSSNTPVDPLPYLQGEKTFNNIDSSFKTFVKNVQASLGAKVDGIPGPDTLNHTITISSKVNNKHKVVKYIQEYLYFLGYKEIGTIDGIAGSKFSSAVKHYQKDNGCVADGIITKKNKSWKKLLKLS